MIKAGKLLQFAVKNKNYYEMSRKLQSIELLTNCRQLVPQLSNDKHKGQAGRIGVVGGSIEYTGAPYYAAITSLKTGADLVYVFCMKEASTVIKSYSPELIVLPYLDHESALSKIKPWLERLHAVLIGPGLGRDPNTFQVVGSIIQECKKLKKPLVIDADGLFYLNDNFDIIKDYPSNVVLTPNIMELSRLVKGEDYREKCNELFNKCPKLTIVRKGPEDVIFNKIFEANVSAGGSGRRSGGQGDLLAGCLSTLLVWALTNCSNISNDMRPILAAYSACNIVRRCNQLSFQKLGRSMTALDMTHEIHASFKEFFQTV